MSDVIQMRHGSSIGQPITRRDGELKVTGRADYAADHHPEGMLYAVMATSQIARGASPRSTSRPQRRIPASSP